MANKREGRILNTDLPHIFKRPDVLFKPYFFTTESVAHTRHSFPITKNVT